jgi:ribonuclease P protein component
MTQTPARQIPAVQAPAGQAATGQAPAKQTLPRTERLRRRPDFEQVYQQGLKTPGRYMTLFLLKNGQPVSRLGIAATRKIGNAVVRNRAKRLVRAIYRQHKPAPGLDIVIIPRREFLSVEFASLEAEYQSILSRRASRAPGPVGRTSADRTAKRAAKTR